MCYVKFIDNDKIVSDFLFCKEIKESASGENVFNLINKYFKENNLSWMKVISVCTDGAPSMIGSKKGLIAYIQKENSSIIGIHCTIHKEALACKFTSEELENVFVSITKMINYIKASPLRNRRFDALVLAMCNDKTKLLYHNEVRWLSRGNVCKSFYNKRRVIKEYIIEEKRNDFLMLLDSNQWCERLFFLTQLSIRLNELNLSLQEDENTLIQFEQKIKAFMQKLRMWKTYSVTGDLTMFDINITEENEYLISDTNIALDNLINGFEKYFPSLDLKIYDWIVYPLKEVDLQTTDLNFKEKEELINPQSERSNFKKFDQFQLDG